MGELAGLGLLEPLEPWLDREASELAGLAVGAHDGRR